MALSLSRVLVEFSLKLAYIPPCVRKTFIFMVFTFVENVFTLDIFSHIPPHAKLAPKFLPLHPRQKEITHSPRQHFRNLFPPTAQRGGENYYLLYQNSVRKYEDDLGH